MNEQIVMNEQFDMNKSCASCVHSLGSHFTTYNGNRQGCIIEDQTDGRCRCTGFTVAFQPKTFLNFRPLT
jgi:hypothetical protein